MDERERDPIADILVPMLNSLPNRKQAEWKIWLGINKATGSLHGEATTPICTAYKVNSLDSLGKGGVIIKLTLIGLFGSRKV